jgi:hypothetical protein
MGDGNWDVIDNVIMKWVSTGNPCSFLNGWNHLTIQNQREPDNTSLVQYHYVEWNDAGNQPELYALFGSRRLVRYYRQLSNGREQGASGKYGQFDFHVLVGRAGGLSMP